MAMQRWVCVRDVVSCRLTSSAEQRVKRVRKEISVGGMGRIVEVTGEDSIMGSNSNSRKGRCLMHVAGLIRFFRDTTFAFAYPLGMVTVP